MNPKHNSGFILSSFSLSLLFLPMYLAFLLLPDLARSPPPTPAAEQAGNRLPVVLSGHRRHRISAVWLQHRSHQCPGAGLHLRVSGSEQRTGRSVNQRDHHVCLNFLSFIHIWPLQKLRSFFNDTWMERYKQPISPGACTVVWSVAVAIFSVGGMVGSFSVGVMANRFGR